MRGVVDRWKASKFAHSRTAVALSGSPLVCGAHFEDGAFGGVGTNPYNENASESGAVFVYH